MLGDLLVESGVGVGLGAQSSQGETAPERVCEADGVGEPLGVLRRLPGGAQGVLVQLDPAAHTDAVTVGVEPELAADAALELIEDFGDRIFRYVAAAGVGESQRPDLGGDALDGLEHLAAVHQRERCDARGGEIAVPDTVGECGAQLSDVLEAGSLHVLARVEGSLAVRTWRRGWLGAVDVAAYI